MKQSQNLCSKTESAVILIAAGMPLSFFAPKRASSALEMFLQAVGDGIGRLFSVWGEVVEENGKTVVNIYSVYSKLEVFLRYFVMIFYSLFVIGFFAVSIIFKIPLSINRILILLWLSFFAFWLLFSLSKENKHGLQDVDIMIEEVTRRIDAIKRWDD